MVVILKDYKLTNVSAVHGAEKNYEYILAYLWSVANQN